MRKLAFTLCFLLTGCLGDRIPWDIAKVKQSDGNICVYAPDIDGKFIFERIKIQRSGETKEFVSNITGHEYAKNNCLPMMGYKFINNNEYNVSFSAVNNSGKRKIYAARFIYQQEKVN